MGPACLVPIWALVQTLQHAFRHNPSCNVMPMPREWFASLHRCFVTVLCNNNLAHEAEFKQPEEWHLTVIWDDIEGEYAH